MAVIQDQFDQYRSNAYDGQVSTTQPYEIDTGVVEGASVMFGRAVVFGTGERSIANVSGTTTAADIVGFSVRSLGVENNSSDLPEYPVGDAASYLRDGRMYALCVGGAAKSSTVHVVINTAGGNQLGQLRGTADGANTIELNRVKWLESVNDGSIGEIIADGILAI